MASKEKFPYAIRFYRDGKGGCQACDYARAMKVTHQAAVKRWFIELAQRGPRRLQNHLEPLRDGVWELRIPVEHHQHRFLYLFHGKTVLVTNAFLKKLWKVPKKEIEVALTRYGDWVGRKGWREAR